MTLKKIKKIFLNNVDENGSDMQDREYIDLSQVWHDASEVPQGTYIVLCDGLDNIQWVVDYLHIDMSYANWKYYADAIKVNRWAYVSDLMPKGGNYEKASD